MNTPTWVTAVCSGGSFMCAVILKMVDMGVSKIYDAVAKKKETPDNEVLLFGAEDEEHMKKLTLNNLVYVNYVLSEAKRSVDVCVPSLASEALAECLVTAQQKGKLKTRIVIHNSSDFTNLQLFAQNGIEVKVIKPAVPLEHEFILVDAAGGGKDAAAVMGSLEHAPQPRTHTHTAVIVSYAPAVIEGLSREFERVWLSAPDKTRD